MKTTLCISIWEAGHMHLLQTIICFHRSLISTSTSILGLLSSGLLLGHMLFSPLVFNIPLCLFAAVMTSKEAAAEPLSGWPTGGYAGAAPGNSISSSEPEIFPLFSTSNLMWQHFQPQHFLLGAPSLF